MIESRSALMHKIDTQTKESGNGCNLGILNLIEEFEQFVRKDQKEKCVAIIPDEDKSFISACIKQQIMEADE